MKHLIFLLVILSASSCSNEKDPVACPDYTCDDFVNQKDAQDVFDGSKDCLQVMDNDNDGVACEHLLDNGTDGGGGTGGGGGTSGCPTTANCGCSGKLKSQCESAACCQWIVGTGCKCK